MKKLLSLILVGIMTFSMVACGNGDTSGAEVSSAGRPVEVEENLLTVEITLPASFWEDSEETVEEYANRMKDEGKFKDVTANSDGSVTVKMSKADHKKMLEEFKAEIVSMFPDESYPSIYRIEINDDYTDCRLIVNQAAFENSFDGIAILGVSLGAQMYHIFEGEPDAVTVIHYIDEETNTEFDTKTIPNDVKEDK